MVPTSKRTGLAILLLAVWGMFPQAAAKAQPASRDTMALSLDQAIEYGLKNAVSTREAQRLIANAEQRKREAISRGYPQVSASVGYTGYPSLPVSLIPSEFTGGPPGGEPLEVQFGTPHNASARAELSQLVIDGAYFLGVKATKMLVNVEVERTKLSEIDLRHNITQSYYSGLIANLQVVSVQRNLDLVRKLAGETRAYLNAGFVEEIEADRLDRAVAELGISLNSALRDQDLAHDMLRYYMNMDLDQPIALTDRLDSLLLTDALSGQESFSPENRLEYQLLLLQEETNEMNVRYNRNLFVPTLTAFASYEQQAQRQEFNFFNADEPWFEIAVVGFNLNIPIFDGFYKRSLLEQAQLQLEGIRLQQESVSMGLQLEVARARATYLSTADRLTSLQQSRDLAEKIYNVTQVKYREGVGSSLELNTALQDFQNAEDQYIAGMYQLLMARTDLKKALGKYPTNDPR
jgi:outer membrane protein TolC